MRRLSTIGMCVAVAMALSVVVVSSASARQPEFEATGGFPTTFTSQSLLPLQPELRSTVSGAEVKILCQMSAGTGEITSAVLLLKIKTTFTGCKIAGTSQACTTSGSPTGTITTKEIIGLTGFVTGETLAGILLEPLNATTKIFAEFGCGVVIPLIVVENAIIGKAIPFKVSSEEGELVFEELNANQKFRQIVGGPICELVVNKVAKGLLMDSEHEKFSKVVTLK